MLETGRFHRGDYRMRTRLTSYSKVMIRLPLISSLLLLAVVLSARGQGNLPEEKSSLAGITSLTVDITVEGPSSLAETEVLGASALRHRVAGRLRDRGVPVAATRDDHPNLIVHLNLMELQNGLIPFSIELGLYQSVLLARNRERMDAETWNESLVGLVSRDRINLIVESVDGLVDQFVQDFKATN